MDQNISPITNIITNDEAISQILNDQMLMVQSEFIRAMDPNLDCMWWAETLVVEETKELKEALDENHPIEDIIKEVGDVIYVILGTHNVMPANLSFMLSDDRKEKITKIMQDAMTQLSRASVEKIIPTQIMQYAFSVIHVSNMSKIDPETGKPLRREDGKILKGPNYVKPDMTPVVEAHAEIKKMMAQDSQEESKDHTSH